MSDAVSNCGLFARNIRTSNSVRVRLYCLYIGDMTEEYSLLHRTYISQIFCILSLRSVLNCSVLNYCILSYVNPCVKQRTDNYIQNISRNFVQYNSCTCKRKISIISLSQEHSRRRSNYEIKKDFKSFLKGFFVYIFVAFNVDFISHFRCIGT